MRALKVFWATVRCNAWLLFTWRWWSLRASATKMGGKTVLVTAMDRQGNVVKVFYATPWGEVLLGRKRNFVYDGKK